MDGRIERSNGDIELSRFLDGELPPGEREEVEQRLDRSPRDRETFLRMKALSSLVSESATLRLQPEEEAAFDAMLERRIRVASANNFWSDRIGLPFRYVWRLSWQWQATLAITLMLLCYIPILLQTPLNSGYDAAPLINSDYSNVEPYFEENPQAGYDLYGVLSEEEDESKQDSGKTPAHSDQSPIGYYSAFRA